MTYLSYRHHIKKINANHEIKTTSFESSPSWNLHYDVTSWKPNKEVIIYGLIKDTLSMSSFWWVVSLKTGVAFQCHVIDVIILNVPSDFYN